MFDEYPEALNVDEAYEILIILTPSEHIQK